MAKQQKIVCICVQYFICRTLTRIAVKCKKMIQPVRYRAIDFMYTAVFIDIRKKPTILIITERIGYPDTRIQIPCDVTGAEVGRYTLSSIKLMKPGECHGIGMCGF